MAGLKEHYQESCVQQLIKEFGYSSIMQVPKLTKVVLNMGLGEAVQNPKIIEGAVDELTKIAGQKAVVTKAKKSIATFKLREGMPIGCRVTLRGDMMWNFMSKLMHVALPRVRDFRGLPLKSFDGNGNYSMGIKEHIIFPEVDYDKIDKIKGLNISIGTSALSDTEGRFLLKALGMPFRK